MARPADIIEFIESRTGHPLNGDEAITFGPRDQELTGVTVCWTVSPSTIAAAAEAGHNCIVHHEALSLPYPRPGNDPERHFLSWQSNYRRLALLAHNGLTAIRLHGSADELCVFDAFAAQLGLGRPIDDDGSGKYCNKMYASPVGTFAELVEHVRSATSMPAVRTTVEPADRKVARVGLPWGGMGLKANIGYVQTLIDLGADVLIAGETDEYAFYFAAEAGVAMIETSHELSEAPGLRILAGQLAGALGIECSFAERPCIWRSMT